MLSSQEFKDEGVIITLDRDKEDRATVTVVAEESGNKQSLEYPAKFMRKLIKILKDSPFIFSDENHSGLTSESMYKKMNRDW